MSARMPTDYVWQAHGPARPWRSAPLVRASLAEAWRRLHTRRWLADLDERMLKDIGANRAEARAESAKPFWRA